MRQLKPEGEQIKRPVPLTHGKCTLVDEEVFEDLSRFKWMLHKDGYACRFFRVSKHKQDILMRHRYLLPPGDGFEIDHINGNRLDNRKSNLRIVTRQQNMFNKSSHRGTTSTHKGVYWHIRDRKWVASITIDRKQIFLGCFVNESDAAGAYNVAASNLYGEYAKLNQI